jgi:ADP-ribose pyrophosphatase YjhB (NUDIX family)
MVELLHRIKVFVFQQDGEEPNYLLLRANQGVESVWGPIQGGIRYGEKLESAIRREVLDDIGILRPLDLIDLEMPHRQVFGDEEVIDWCFGFKTQPVRSPLRLDPRWAEFRWAEFSEGYPLLEFDEDRAAFLRLHALGS